MSLGGNGGFHGGSDRDNACQNAGFLRGFQRSLERVGKDSLEFIRKQVDIEEQVAGSLSAINRERGVGAK